MKEVYTHDEVQRLVAEAEVRGHWNGLKDAREIANLNAWKHGGEDAYSRGMDEGARHQSRVIHVALSEELLKPSGTKAALQMPRLSKLDAFDPGCPHCEEGWVCENHPEKAWPTKCDCGAGMPCDCNPIRAESAAIRNAGEAK